MVPSDAKYVRAYTLYVRAFKETSFKVLARYIYLQVLCFYQNASGESIATSINEGGLLCFAAPTLVLCGGDLICHSEYLITMPPSIL